MVKNLKSRYDYKEIKNIPSKPMALKTGTFILEMKLAINIKNYKAIMLFDQGISLLSLRRLLKRNNSACKVVC
jgi:hypothetical protein